MNTFKTPKGTELPFLNLKGKFYLQVAHRLVWMREEFPDWSIETTPIKLEPTIAIFEATIKNKDGRIIATAHGMQEAKSFPGGFVEKAETKSVGRALGFAGLGTAHAMELEDDTEIENFADSPIQKKEDNVPDFKSTLANEKQSKMLWAVKQSRGITDERYREILAQFGYKSSKEIKFTDVNKIKEALEK